MSHTNFLGIPVEGEIVRGNKRAQQRPLEDLQPVLRTVLDDSRIEAIRWRQYTPYFADGDPCVFSAYGVSVRPIGGDDEAGDYGDGFLDSWSFKYHGDKDGTPEYLELYELTKELDQLIGGGAFDDVLLEAFGDHAIITVTRDKIVIDFYNHD